MKKFTCKALLGLGITSPTYLLGVLSRHKIIRSMLIEIVDAATYKYPTKADIVVFASLRELIRFVESIRETQVVVVSDVPTLLREISDVVPLDFDNRRSFEFNFKVEVRAFNK